MLEQLSLHIFLRRTRLAPKANQSGRKQPPVSNGNTRRLCRRAIALDLKTQAADQTNAGSRVTNERLSRCQNVSDFLHQAAEPPCASKFSPHPRTTHERARIL